LLRFFSLFFILSKLICYSRFQVSIVAKALRITFGILMKQPKEGE
jgi:hypothetical protein